MNLTCIKFYIIYASKLGFQIISEKAKILLQKIAKSNYPNKIK